MKYPFKNFKFLDENTIENNFQFPTKLVLGLQAEACFEAYLKQSKHYELLGANLQINGEKETLGELDYIVRNLNANNVIHIELACKFYLYDEEAGASEEEKWIGPNRKDKLFDKLEKIKLKQFPLLRKSETVEILENLNIETPTQQQLCLKAFLFLPKRLNSNNFPANYADCVIGFWINYKEFKKEDTAALYAFPPKKEWLLPMETMNNWHSFSEVEKLIEIEILNKKSPLIYKKKQQQLERFFVVWW